MHSTMASSCGQDLHVVAGSGQQLAAWRLMHCHAGSKDLLCLAEKLEGCTGPSGVDISLWRPARAGMAQIHVHII